MPGGGADTRRGRWGLGVGKPRGASRSRQRVPGKAIYGGGIEPEGLGSPPGGGFPGTVVSNWGRSPEVPGHSTPLF